MKYRLFALVAILCMVLGLFGAPAPAQAKSYGVNFISTINYMNVGAEDANITFEFYAEGSTTAVVWPSTGYITLPKNAASSLYAGDVFGTSFKGSVTVSSSQPLAVTAVQAPPTGSTVKVRMVSNGFSIGAKSMTVQSVRKTSAQVSIFSVQNADVDAADLTVNFLVPGNATPIAVDQITNLAAGAAKFYDMGKAITTSDGKSIPATFDGSVVVTAKKTGTTDDGFVVASSSEYDLAASNNKAYAFNAVATGATVVWMPSAFCNYNQGKAGIGPINTYYAIANSSDAPIVATVEYFDGTGTKLYEQVSPSLDPGAKFASNGCAKAIPNTNTPYSGSAKITAAWADATAPGTGDPTVVTVGKVAGKAYSSAFEGIADPGDSKVALPYIRYVTGTKWTDGSRQRTFLAIQNTGTTTWAVGEAKVTFYDNQGVASTVFSNTVAIAPGQKFGLDASTVNANFGYWTSGQGGGAIVEAPAGGTLGVLVRAVTYGGTLGQWSEDYMGIPLP